MPVKIRDEGNYELFETTHDNRILALNDKRWFAWVEGQAGELLVQSDSDHKKKRTVQKGRFYAVDFQDDPKYKDMPHLFLEKDGKYQEAVIPNGLPTGSDHQKKVVMTGDSLEREKLEDYLKNPAEAGPGEERMDRPGGGSMANLTHHLQGVDFPANREDLIKHAKDNGAPQEVISQLEKLAKGSKHDSMADLTSAIGERTWHPPIEDYDRLNVEDIQDQLDKLDRDELKQLKEYEQETKNRKTLQEEFDRRLSA